MKQGFTIIELVIAIGIFAIFITIITGVFTNFMQVQRHAIAQGQLISDITSALESFIKEARTGFGSTYSVDGSMVAFVNQTGEECVAFRKNDDGIFQRAEKSVGGECTTGSFAGENSRFSPITSSATEITDLEFTIPTNVEIDNGVLKNQGVITIKLTAKSKKNPDLPPITIQNSVTSRQMQSYAQ